MTLLHDPGEPASSGRATAMETFERVLDRFIAGCGALTMVAAALAGVIIVIDVAMRGTGIGVLYGGTEIVEYLVFLMAFFSAPWVLRNNGHIRVDFMLTLVPRRVAAVLEIMADVLGIAVVLVIFFYAAKIGAQSFAEGRRVFRSFFFPEWWIFAAACAALIFLFLEFLRRALRGLSGRPPIVSASIDKL